LDFSGAMNVMHKCSDNSGGNKRPQESSLLLSTMSE